MVVAGFLIIWIMLVNLQKFRLPTFLLLERLRTNLRLKKKFDTLFLGVYSWEMKINYSEDFPRKTLDLALKGVNKRGGQGWGSEFA